MEKHAEVAISLMSIAHQVDDGSDFGAMCRAEIDKIIDGVMVKMSAQEVDAMMTLKMMMTIKMIFSQIKALTDSKGEQQIAERMDTLFETLKIKDNYDVMMRYAKFISPAIAPFITSLDNVFAAYGPQHPLVKKKETLDKFFDMIMSKASEAIQKGPAEQT